MPVIKKGTPGWNSLFSCQKTNYYAVVSIYRFKKAEAATTSALRERVTLGCCSAPVNSGGNFFIVIFFHNLFHIEAC